jgi:hypothetical protein
LGWIKTQKNCGKAKLWNLPVWSRVLLTVAWAFDKKIFENESVFPAVERSAATDATHRRVNRRLRNEGSGTDLHVIFLSWSGSLN